MGNVTAKKQNEVESEVQDAKNTEIQTNTSDETKSIFNTDLTFQDIKYPLGVGILGITSAGLWYLKKNK